MSEANTQNKMGYAPMFPLIMKMSLPAIFSMTVMALYNVVDSIFVGNIPKHGELGLNAVSFAFPLQMLLIAFAVGTSIGANSLISRRLGAGNQKEADSAATHSLILAVFTWIVFIFVGLFAVKPFLHMYHCTGKVFEYGYQYLTIVLCLSGFIMVQTSIEKSLQATGDMIFPMLLQLSGAVTNLIFDPLFIYGIGPFPKLEVMGAAIATVLGQFVGMVFGLIVIFFKKNRVKVTFKGFRLDFRVIKNIYAVGFPSIIMQSISSFMILGLNAMLTNIGVTVLGIYFKLQSFIFMPCFGLNQGLLPIMGYNYGAKNKKRLYSALKNGIMIAIVIMTIGLILFQTIPDKLILMFNSENTELMKAGIPAFRLISLCFIPAAISIVLISMFQATGKGMRALVLSITRQLIFILPVAFIISQIIGSQEWIWLAFPIAEIATLALAISLFINLTKTDFKKLDE
ncbi:MAG: MATE family efflux transporter [Ruminococcus sp.]|nr:MATE family efflux transporter [Ruminococcus sp.]